MIAGLSLASVPALAVQNSKLLGSLKPSRGASPKSAALGQPIF